MWVVAQARSRRQQPDQVRPFDEFATRRADDQARRRRADVLDRRQQLRYCQERSMDNGAGAPVVQVDAAEIAAEAFSLGFCLGIAAQDPGGRICAN